MQYLEGVLSIQWKLPILCFSIGVFKKEKTVFTDNVSAGGEPVLCVNTKLVFQATLLSRCMFSCHNHRSLGLRV